MSKHKPIEKGSIELVEKVPKKGADVNIQDEEGTALMRAAKKGQTEIVQELLEKGADVNIKSSNGGTTALMYAAKNGHQQIVQELLEKGADVNIQNKYGSTALILAAQKGYAKIARQLMTKVAEQISSSQNGLIQLRNAAAIIKKKDKTLFIAISLLIAQFDPNYNNIFNFTKERLMWRLFDRLIFHTEAEYLKHYAELITSMHSNLEPSIKLELLIQFDQKNLYKWRMGMGLTPLGSIVLLPFVLLYLFLKNSYYLVSDYINGDPALKMLLWTETQRAVNKEIKKLKGQIENKDNSPNSSL